MAVYTLSVPDISCNHCVNRIRNALRIEGVQDLDIDLDNRQIALRTDRIEEVLHLISELGYPGQILS